MSKNKHYLFRRQKEKQKTKQVVKIKIGELL